jgi:hypothetical protein
MHFSEGADMAMVSMACGEGEGDDDAAERMAEVFGPGHVDQMIRQGVGSCWMALPRHRRNIDELEKQVRRIVDRALRDFREDSEEFRAAK